MSDNKFIKEITEQESRVWKKLKIFITQIDYDAEKEFEYRFVGDIIHEQYMRLWLEDSENQKKTQS